jgi:hypothetical protein
VSDPFNKKGSENISGLKMFSQTFRQIHLAPMYRLTTTRTARHRGEIAPACAGPAVASVTMISFGHAI